MLDSWKTSPDRRRRVDSVLGRSSSSSSESERGVNLEDEAVFRIGCDRLGGGFACHSGMQEQS